MSRKPNAPKGVKIVHVAGFLFVKKAITSRESVGAELTLEICNARRVASAVICRGQQFEPDRILPQPLQAKHPLQRYGKVSAAFEIFRGKAATEENRHVLDHRM
jgi:hypothetical protein